jgi:hypothetical protein
MPYRHKPPARLPDPVVVTDTLLMVSQFAEAAVALRCRSRGEFARVFKSVLDDFQTHYDKVRGNRHSSAPASWDDLDRMVSGAVLILAKRLE